MSAMPILLAALAVPAGAFLLGSLVRRLCRLATPADEVRYAPTADGWLLALHRYRPGPTAEPARFPVILCHGLLSNRFVVDLDEDHSLARHLRRRGFDVWVMELRGHGLSHRAATGGLRPFDWTIDDYVRQDLPAVVKHVREATGAAQVHWFGHSLGGMILYAACALGLTAGIRSAVMGDVPGSFRDDRRPGRFGMAYVRLIPAVPPLLVIPFTLLLGLLSPSLFLPRYGIHRRRTMLRIVSNGIVDFGSSKVARQLIGMIERRCFTSADGAIDYEEGVARLHFPVLQLAAVARRSPEAVVRALIERCPVADRTYRRLARSEGFSEDYNHFTLLLGENAPREVYPIVAAFLERTGREG